MDCGGRSVHQVEDEVSVELILTFFELDPT